MNKSGKARKFHIAFRADCAREDLVDRLIPASKHITYIGVSHSADSGIVAHDVWMQTSKPLSYSTLRAALKPYDVDMITSDFEEPGDVNFFFGTFKKRGRNRTKMKADDIIIQDLRDTVKRQSSEIEVLRIQYDSLRLKKSKGTDIDFDIDDYDL
jgi:hypothetical protein